VLEEGQAAPGGEGCYGRNRREDERGLPERVGAVDERVRARLERERVQRDEQGEPERSGRGDLMLEPPAELDEDERLEGPRTRERDAGEQDGRPVGDREEGGGVHGRTPV